MLFAWLQASEVLGSSGGAENLGALTGLALAFFGAAREDLATGPPAYSEICLALERLHLNGNADVCHAITGLALAFRGKLEKTCWRER